MFLQELFLGLMGGEGGGGEWGGGEVTVTVDDAQRCRLVVAASIIE